MNLFEIGSILGAITAPTFLILTLKRRWLYDEFLEDLFKWWDGNIKGYNNVDVILGGALLFFVTLFIFLLTLIAWPFVIPIAILAYIVNMIRNKRVAKMKKQALKDAYYGTKNK